MTPGGTRVARLGGEDFRLLTSLLSETFGLAFAAHTRSVIERRLAGRLAHRGVTTFAEYYHFLRFHPEGRAELHEAVELLLTHETYFYREDYQLVSFREEVLPALAAKKRDKKISLWSAGCSTGEEAFTLGMLVLESGLFEGWDVTIYGSDLSRRAIAHARRGVYRPGAFRVTDAERRGRFFEEVSEGARVRDEVRALCHFGQMNLLESDKARLVGRVDVVFCRNVLIYLEPEARKRVIAAFHDALHPGGLLFLGHAESLLNVTTAFELEHLARELAYKKPEAKPALDGIFERLRGQSK